MCMPWSLIWDFLRCKCTLWSFNTISTNTNDSIKLIHDISLYLNIGFRGWSFIEFQMSYTRSFGIILIEVDNSTEIHRSFTRTEIFFSGIGSAFDRQVSDVIPTFKELWVYQASFWTFIFGFSSLMCKLSFAYISSEIRFVRRLPKHPSSHKYCSGCTPSLMGCTWGENHTRWRGVGVYYWILSGWHQYLRGGDEGCSDDLLAFLVTSLYSLSKLD